MNRSNTDALASFNPNFVLSHFEHHATFNSEANSVEMHIRSLTRQTVAVPRAGLYAEFESGETIWTESCHKYSLEQVRQEAQAAGFEIEARWIDHEWPFAESLLVVSEE